MADNFYASYPVEGGSSVVTIYPNVAAFPVSTTTGDLAVDASTGNLYEFNGSSWVQIAGPGGALSLGNLDSQATTAKGAALTGGVLSMQSADATHPGLINNAAQSFSGNKTFTGTIVASNLSGTNTGDVTLSTANGLSILGQALSLGLSSTSTTGALSSTDWNTFNGKAAPGNYITDLSGDVVANGPGAVSATIQALAVTGAKIANATISLTTKVTGILPIANGGTNSTTALNNNRFIVSKSGTIVEQTAIGASLALVSDTNGLPATNVTTAAEIGFVNGVTSNIQTQLNAKQGAVSIGALDAQTANANGLALVSSVLSAQSADATHPGMVNITTQTFAGQKTFSTGLTGTLTGHASLDLALTGGTMSGAIDMGSNLIHNVTDPTVAQDAATKAYVDASVAALNPATSVYAATLGTNIAGTYLNGVAGVGATFTTTATGTFTIDGVTPPLAARILIKDQSSGFQNGIYTITTLGSIGVSTVFTRALDYNTASDMNQAGLIPVINGTLNALSSWQQTATITTVGTDALVFQEFTANPSLYLLKANNLSDVASKTTSFNNLSPMTTGGDIIYGGASGAGTRLANGSSGQLLTSSGGTAAPTWTTVAPGITSTVWTSDNAAITFPAGWGTVSSKQIFKKREGDTLYIRATFTTGTVSGGQATFMLGNSLAIDSAKLPTATQYVGHCAGGQSSTVSLGPNNAAFDVYYNGSDTTQVYITYQTGTSGYVSQLVNTIINTGQPVTVEFSVPISGWTQTN